MLKKTKKKGFTLIEMLVVIAIIAALVSLIVPKVQKEVIKAAAATNAANLRSIEGKIAVMRAEDIDGFELGRKRSPTVYVAANIRDVIAPFLEFLGWTNFSEFADELLYKKTADLDGNLVLWTDPKELKLTGVPGAKKMTIEDASGNKITISDGTPMQILISETAVVATYDDLTLEAFADIAEDGVFDGTIEGSSSGGSTGGSSGGFIDDIFAGLEKWAAIEKCEDQGTHAPDAANGCKCPVCKQVDHGVSEDDYHNCPKCGTEISQCKDKAKSLTSDHTCDICGRVMDELCEDNLGKLTLIPPYSDGKCDTCKRDMDSSGGGGEEGDEGGTGGETAHTCTDANTDHICDGGCGKPVGTHNVYGAKTQDRHYCTYCKQGEAHVQQSNKHTCACGHTTSTCSDNATDGDHKCDICGNSYGSCADNNDDLVCDDCGKCLCSESYTIKIGNCGNCGHKKSDHWFGGCGG